MIKQFSLKNFKSYRDAVLPLSTLTVLIGANASGKSNLIEAIRILAWLANGRRLGDLLQSIARDDISIRGSIESVFNDQQNFTLGCKIIDPMVEDFNNLYVTIDFSDNEMRISDSDIIPKITNIYQNSLENIIFLNPNPSKMRGYSFISDKILRFDGSNVSSVLYHIIASNQKNKEYILSFVESLPEQHINNIDFIRTARNEVMVQLEETFSQKHTYRDVTLLSDGTLRVLAITAALLSAPSGSVVIIEEIDNGVHPSRAHDLINNIQRVAQERELQVLITSHNPALLDALPLQSVGDVVCCYRDPDDGDSRLVRLSQLSDYPELVARGSLGALMTQGIIDRFVKDKRTDEQRIEDDMTWLQQLQQEVE